MSSLFIVHAVVYCFALWFGLYLLGRSGGKPGLYFAGFGLVAYAVGLAMAHLSRYIPSTAAILSTGYPLLLLLPAGFWFGAAWSLLAEHRQITLPANRLIALIPLIILGIALLLIGNLARYAVALIPIILSLAALWRIWKAFRENLPRPPLKIMLTATMFFFLSSALILLPTEILSNELVLLAISADLALLGYAIAKLDAYDEGTALLPDAMRSLCEVALVAGLVGGQLWLFVAKDGVDYPFVVLFYTILSTVIALFTLHHRFQKLLDRFLFGESGRIARERSDLIAVTEALPRLDETLDPLALDEAEFTRLTRRALTHYNDLGKLASSPLTRLPIIAERLAGNNRIDTSLERAHELRSVLKEQILRLKPYSDKDFDTGDEWRYYNALYFPYLLGLKPYNVRPSTVEIDSTVQEAMDWFQTYIPERTLYNWQNSAAKLVAQQLRETTRGSEIRLRNSA